MDEMPKTYFFLYKDKMEQQSDTSGDSLMKILGYERCSLSSIVHAMPKVELHRHLEGSIRFPTLMELYPHHCNDDESILTVDVKKHFCITERIESLTEFMDKFEHTQQVLATPDIIERVAFEACEDAALQNIIILELRYSPMYILRGHESTLGDIESIHESVLAGIKRAEVQYPDIVVGLIGVLDRCSSLEDATIATDFFIQHKNTFVGVDLANDEERYDALHFAPLFKRYRDAGLQITVHAGEIPSTKSSSNVEIAIEQFCARRIGHGINVLRDESIVKNARDSGIVFEVCPTSNVLIGSVDSLSKHPIREMLNQNLRVTLSTDDPGLFLINLEQECSTALLQCGLSLHELWQCQIEGYCSSFIANVKKEEKWRRAIQKWEHSKSFLSQS